MPHPLSRVRSADEYGGVLATFGPSFRVILEPHGLAWGVQKRRANRAHWFTVTATLIHRASLAKAALSHMRGTYADKHGITAETVAKALEHLPEIYRPSPYKPAVASEPVSLGSTASV